jgi:glutamate-ammonia-ligase adenylyltransferase
LGAYFENEAKPWEALAYLRLRFVAGDPDVGQAAMAAVQEQLAAVAAKSGFDAELSAVRERLEKADSGPNLKSGPGGAYDIDYLLGRLQLRHHIWTADTLAARIAALHKSNVLPAAAAQSLQEQALLLRMLEHIVRLVTARPSRWLPSAEHPRRSAATLLNELLPDRLGRTPEQRLAYSLEETRALYLRCTAG